MSFFDWIGGNDRQIAAPEYTAKRVKGNYYKIKGTFSGGRLRDVDVWKRPNITSEDKLRNRLFERGQRDPAFRIKPQFRDYPHWKFSDLPVKVKDGEVSDPSTFMGKKGGRVHGVEGKVPLKVVKKALDGRLSAREQKRYFRA